jgi:hypothetical protein
MGIARIIYRIRMLTREKMVARDLDLPIRWGRVKPIKKKLRVEKMDPKRRPRQAARWPHNNKIRARQTAADMAMEAYFR